jgi:uncharacterized protein
MRIAAVADLHFFSPRFGVVPEQLTQVRDQADLLILAGDLTNYGKPSEMEELLKSLVRLRLPIVAVLGNHDYESGAEVELSRMMTQEGIKLLDGTAYERDGIGFAGTKGFPGGFGRGALTSFGEREVKAFVQAGIDEAVKLERAMSQLRTQKRVVVLHYAPIGDTIQGEAPEIFPYPRARPQRVPGRQDHGRRPSTQCSPSYSSGSETASGVPGIRNLKCHGK